MLFNSIDFAIFLPLMFAIYWLANKCSLRIQNLVVLIGSYIFYGSWDWKFLLLIIFSTVVDYTVALGIEKTEQKIKRKLLLFTSLAVNLGLLGVFKYYNFFIENFVEAFAFLGWQLKVSSLNLILPVGISFYTFQTMSYTIDVYRKQLKPTTDFIAFGAFVSFFPQLVAGPIERATQLLPQFYKRRTFDYANAINGLRQILWGLFKKMVIADNCAELANSAFNSPDILPASSLVLGAFFFSMQIYGDFSGYSDIAIGTARLFGFKLMQNFAFPYFSRDIAEFWRRWHISLSTWFRDYVYIPLGGSRGGKWMKIRNTFAIFLISGFWHGANWTFIVWGALNAIYFLPLLLRGQNRKNLNVVAENRFLPSIRELFALALTFSLTVFAWIFFRAENMPAAIHYIQSIFDYSLLEMPYFIEENTGQNILPKMIFLLLIFFFSIEWLGRREQYAIEKILDPWPSLFRYLFYYGLIFMIFYFSGKEQDFIYFQF
ncbi:MBOAT family O-acyltransferase [Saprospira grandis]|uniref:Membrane bound o-acyl transferase mboat family protein n=1 Tax=Saprospira grandis (strain Lewin) TaxID=984262 RepID=H6L8Z9_SAPGL|nr:MBOAT family O-acyltransferase [Saprospira grandis]AFC23135.1 membrane bound o-acyl transferase mboat family protein [Saprospira grandis str. Lewin]